MSDHLIGAPRPASSASCRLQNARHSRKKSRFYMPSCGGQNGAAVESQTAKENRMVNTWVVVADGTRARLFNRHKNRKLEEFDVLLSPEHRLHEGDLVSDREGRASANGAGGNAMGNRNSTKNHEMANFAKRLASRLERGRTAGEVGRLVLVAPPRFLGQLRASLSVSASELVALSIDKELTTLSADKLQHHLPEYF
jgi:protein required for attachment to host cells